jgi:hypothetical protein
MNVIPNIIYPAENMLTINTMDNPVRQTLDAWLKFGTVFLVYRICTYFFFDRYEPDAHLFDKESLLLVFFILIGFTIYYLLVKPYIPISSQHPIIKNLENDMLMFGTVLVSSHLLEAWMDDGDYFNKEWLKTAGVILLSFATYDIIVNPFIPFDNMRPTVKPIVHDWAKYGTFLIVFRLLQGRAFDTKWILSVLFALFGFTIYQLVTKKLVNVE